MKQEQDEKKLWVEARITVDPELQDSVSDFLISELGRGVILEDAQDKVLIKAYLSKEDLESGALTAIETYLENISNMHSGHVDIQVDLDHIVEEDWHQGWKKYFKPLKIGKTLIVKPTWETYVPEPHEKVIEIDPGMAFGVGTHASTRLMLEELERLSMFKGLENKDVLDVGTGTGILAIWAAKLGARSVIAIDVDPDAVEAARKNVKLNLVGQKVAVSATPLWEIEGPFDLVLANLDKETLILLAKDMAERVKSKGILLASGILMNQVQPVEQAFKRHSMNKLELVIDQKDKEWALLKFQKNT